MRSLSRPSSFHRSLLVPVIVLLASCAIWTGSLAAAEEEEGQNLGDLETQEAASMRETTYKELAKAQEAAEDERFAEAAATLDKLGKQELNNYERSQLLNLYAYIYYSQDQIQRAISTYEQLLGQPELPEALETSTVFTLSQLYFSQEQYRKSIEMLTRWMSLTHEETRTAYEMMSQAYYQLGEYDKAIGPARKVIELARAAGEPVREQSLLLLRVLYYEAERFDDVVDVLEQLIRQYPKKQYWMQLASIYGEMEDQQKQLNVLELAYLQGYLTSEIEIKTLASLMLNNDLYARAGKVLEKGIEQGVVSSSFEHWRLVAQAWTMAHEDQKAVPALIRAAELSTDGKIDVVLAQTYMNLGRWEEAVDAVERGLAKGGLDRPDGARIMLGQALFELDRFDEARAAFQSVRDDRDSRQMAAQWLNYIDSEEDRREQLEAALE